MRRRPLLLGLALGALGARARAAAPASGWRLSVALTMSLEADTLDILIRRVGQLAELLPARLVLRGLPVDDGFLARGYFAADPARRAAHRASLRRAAARLAPWAGVARIDIDPDFLRRYGIDEAPVWVLERFASDPGPGPEDGPEALLVRGNLSPGRALAELLAGARERGLSGRPGFAALARRLETLDWP